MSEKTSNDTTKDHEEKEVTGALETFETRWKYAVFPAMIAFVVLAGFGFYLIYGMLQRMEDIAEDIDDVARVMRDSLPVMQGGVVGMSSRMQWIGEDLRNMQGDVHKLSNVIQNTMPSMEGKVDNMSKNIGSMTYATSSMASTTQNMGQNLWSMNRNISKPLSVMRKMMPFGGDKSPPPPPMYNIPRYGQYGAAAARPTQQAVAVKPKAPAVDKATVASTNAPKAAVVAPENKSVSLGKQKYINLCASCHGTSAEGGVGPSLRNHSVEETEAIFAEYRSGARVGTMTGIVKTFTTRDVSNIAHFLEAYEQNEDIVSGTK